MQPELDQAQSALLTQIEDFRKEHEGALFDSGSQDHSRRTGELAQLYERLYPSADPENVVIDEKTGQVSAPTELDQIAADAVAPLKAPDFEISQDSQWGINIDQETYGWNSELEGDARSVFERAGLNGAEALTIAQAYAEVLPANYDQEQGAANAVRAIRENYGEDRVSEVVEATNRMLRAYAGPEFYRFIQDSRLGTNPTFVNAAVRFAQRQGYFR